MADRFLILWHPDSPGARVPVRVGLLRRLGLRRSPFATLGETVAFYRALTLVRAAEESRDA